MKIALPIIRNRINGWFLLAAGALVMLLAIGLGMYAHIEDSFMWSLLVGGALLAGYGIGMFFNKKLALYVYEYMLIIGLFSMALIMGLAWKERRLDLFFPLLLALHMICSLLIRRFRNYLIYALSASLAFAAMLWLTSQSIGTSLNHALPWLLMVGVMSYYHFWRIEVEKEKRLHFHLFQEMLDQSSRAMFLIDMEKMKILSTNEPGLRLSKQMNRPPQHRADPLLEQLGFHLIYLKKRFKESSHRWEEKSFFRLKLPDQKELILEILLRKLSQSGQSYLLLRIQDVTGLRAKERDLERSLSFNKSLVSAIPDMLVSLDAFNHISSLQLPASYPQEKMSQFEEGSFELFLTFLVIQEVDQARIFAALQQLRSRGGTFELALEGRVENQPHYFDLRLVGLGIQGEVLCMFRDISIQHLKDLELQQSESRYKTLVENMNEGLVMTDPEERILFVNHRMAEIFQTEVQHLLGKKSYEIFQNEESGREIIARTQNRKNGISEEYELSVSLENGQQRELMIAAAPYLNKQQQYLGTIAVMTDITDRKLTEKKLKEKKFELDSFMYKASHDLKGPLASIMGVSNIAQEEIGETAAKRYFQLITQSAKKLDNILSELINLTRINSSSLSLEVIDLEILVSDIIQSLKYLDEAKKMTFSIQIQHQKPLVSDSKLLHSILQNLIYNSILYRNRDLDHPSVSIISSDSPSGIELCVRDNGIGIPKRIQGRVFEMFYRGNTQSKGSGLGLYIVKTAAEKLDLYMDMNSQENIGTEFILRFPESRSERLPQPA